ncbi:Ras-related protein [Trichinella pseudospiralis]
MENKWCLVRRRHDATKHRQAVLYVVHLFSTIQQKGWMILFRRQFIFSFGLPNIRSIRFENGACLHIDYVQFFPICSIGLLVGIWWKFFQSIQNSRAESTIFHSAFQLFVGKLFLRWQQTMAQMYQQRDGGSDQNFDYMFKILIIGNSSVGKTSFLFRYCDDSFTSAFVSTVGIDFKVKTVFRGDKRVKLQIWDTAGQERYRTITTAYYRGAMGFILMYDITNEESFNSVQDWCTQIKTYSWDNAQVVLVGNKCDMEDERVVSYERGKQLADQLGLEFFEASAKENVHVKAVFERLVDIICDKMAESLDSDPTMTHAKGTRLTDTPTNRGKQTQGCNC